MWPDIDETPPHDADALLPVVLRRGRELRRQRTRRAQATLLSRAAAVMAVLGLGAALARGTNEDPVRTDVAAPTTTADDNAPGTSSSTFPPFTVGGPAGTSPLAPGSSTTVGAAGDRNAPVVVLEVRNPDGRYHTAVLEPGAVRPLAITAATSERQNPVISPDGRSVAFQRLEPHPLTGQPRWELFVIDPDGTDLKQVTGSLLGEGSSLPDPSLGPGTRWPSWSPDGRLLAYSCSGPTGLPQVCLSGADGRGRRAITLEGEGFYQPVWSPDGQRIAAKREVTPGRVGLWVLDPEARRDPVQLPTPVLDARGVTVTWLPDGTLVYPLTDDPAGAMRALDVATGVVRVIPATGPVRFPIACGRDQVLYLQSSAPVDGTGLRTGALVLTGTDGSGTTVLLPLDEDQERVPSSCAMP